MNPSSIEIFATAMFACAVVHTFVAPKFEALAHKCPSGSARENFFHLIGEVEVVFGIWAAILLGGLYVSHGGHAVIEYMESRNFTEPVFVFAIMAIAATRPVLQFANTMVTFISRLIPLNPSVSYYFVALTVGPLLGSLITEPAAMTVTALMLRKAYYDKDISERLKYMTLGLLFVNISIGGTLTNFAAPPVLMVAGKWEWDAWFMISHFGWKSTVSVIIGALAATYINLRELRTIRIASPKDPEDLITVPMWVMLLHLAFLGMLVINAHHMVIFVGVFMMFLGLTAIFRHHHEYLKLKESALVAVFLGGLVVLGGYQRWWLEPVITTLSSETLFAGATALTAITDNAALTYLGAQVPTLSDISKHALVAGAVAGGGLTVIANAPNPAGFNILNSRFGPNGISPFKLLISAFFPTILAMALLWFLPHLG